MGYAVHVEGVAVLVNRLVCREDSVGEAGGRAQILVEKGDGVDQDGVGVAAIDANDGSPSAEAARRVRAAMLCNVGRRNLFQTIRNQRPRPVLAREPAGQGVQLELSCSPRLRG